MKKFNGGLELQKLLGDHKTFIHYDGSRTTPTCDETVTWFVFTKVNQIKKSDLDKIKLLMA